MNKKQFIIMVAIAATIFSFGMYSLKKKENQPQGNTVQVEAKAQSNKTSDKGDEAPLDGPPPLGM